MERQNCCKPLHPSPTRCILAHAFWHPNGTRKGLLSTNIMALWILVNRQSWSEYYLSSWQKRWFGFIPKKCTT